MVLCISRKVGGQAVQSLGCYLVLIVLLNNFQCSASVLATTIASVVSPNATGTSEPLCSAVKDIFMQRGIADKDLPANFPIKGESSRRGNAWFTWNPHYSSGSRISNFSPFRTKVSNIKYWFAWKTISAERQEENEISIRNNFATPVRR